MKLRHLLVGITVSFFLTSCDTSQTEAGVEGKTAQVKRAPINTNFYQNWVHSYEEQNGNPTLNIFRPAGSQEFSPGGFRMEYAFNTNGECSYKDKNSSNMFNCVFTKIGKKVYLYDIQGKLLSHMIFTLVEEPSANQMSFTYGIKAPVKKEEPKKK